MNLDLNLQIFFIKTIQYLLVCVCAYLSTCAAHLCNVHRGQKKTSDAAELDLQAAVKPPMWAQRTTSDALQDLLPMEISSPSSIPSFL